MSLLKSFKRDRAIKAYIAQLPRILAKDYGKSEYYTPPQVVSSIERAGLSSMYCLYAQVLFCESDSFSQFVNLPLSEYSPNQNLTYTQLRHELADTFFNSKIKFTNKDIIACTPDYLGLPSFGGSCGDSSLGSDG